MSSDPNYSLAMAWFLYHCPNTGLSLQGRVAGDPATYGDRRYQPLTCSACARLHLINPNTGHVLGEPNRTQGPTKDSQGRVGPF
jgi:hypothetical protein